MKRVLLMNNQGATYGLPLSWEAIRMLEKLTGICIDKLEAHIDCVVRRDCQALFEVVEKLGEKAFDESSEAQWRIVEVPDDMNWAIAFRENGDEILYDADTSIEPEFERKTFSLGYYI